MSQIPQITIQSSAMFATWVFHPADHVCFDMGDGLTTRLRHKLIKIDTVALTHGHRDHVAGLFMFLAVRCNHEGRVTIYYPRDSRLPVEMARFMPTFHRNAREQVDWVPVEPGVLYPLSKKNLYLRPFANDHYRIDDDRVRSVGYHMVEAKKKVRGPLRDLSQQEIFALIKSQGREAVLEDVEETYLTVSGDTAPLPAAELAGTPVLLHEATFLNEEDRANADGEARFHKHSTLDEALASAVAARVGRLALYHFSTRYTPGEIMEAVRAAIARHRPDFPVSVAMPGALVDDVLQYDLTTSRPGAKTPVVAHGGTTETDEIETKASHSA